MDTKHTHLHLIASETEQMLSAELRRYLDYMGRVKSWPAKRAARMLVYTYLASFFQLGQVYSEQEANQMLRQHLACDAYDYVTVRRDLCDFRYLQRERDGSQYWRVAKEEPPLQLDKQQSKGEPHLQGISEPQEMEAELQMGQAKTKRSSATAILAEHILAEIFGAPVRLGSSADLGGSVRSKVVRFPILEGPASCPASVIVKQANTETFEPDTANNTAWWFFNDWASLQFLSQLETPTPLAPRFYGGNRQAGLFVMEDLGQGIRLDHLLLGNNAETAEAGLLAYAKMHGRLHALTLGREGEYLRIREALGPATPQDPYYNYGWLTSALRSMVELLELEIAPEVEAELAALETMLNQPGPFHVFIQADAAPDNVLHDGASWRLVDFEGGHYTHALLEGVYCRMPFPTCWCVYRLPDEIMQRAEAAYRAELARACPEATDDKRFYQAVVEACVTWALNFHTHMRPLENMLAQDRSLVALTDRQRLLLYLNAAAHACAEFGHMPATGASLRAIATRLSQLWPEAVEPPCYPPFC